MMPWLLKFDGYPPGVIFALLLHGFLLYILLPNRISPDQFVTVEEPVFITATMSTENPQRLRRIEDQQAQRRNEQAEQQRKDEAREREQRQVREQQQAEERRVAEQRQTAEKEETARQERAKQDQQRQAEERQAEERQKEQERQRIAREDAERQEQARQQQQTRDQQAREDAERAEQLLNANASAESNLVAQYAAIIKQLISNNWNLPPGARNGMTAVVTIRLVPTGEIIDSRIRQSSGDAAFDSSVLQAVERAESFPELQDLPPAVFDKNFREISLQFTPEDLLR